jgi:hypothetical protein
MNIPACLFLYDQVKIVNTTVGDPPVCYSRQYNQLKTKAVYSQQYIQWYFRLTGLMIL